MFIVLVGTPGSGKDTIARYLESKHGFLRVGTEISSKAVSLKLPPRPDSFESHRCSSVGTIIVDTAVSGQEGIPIPVEKLPPQPYHAELEVGFRHDMLDDRGRAASVHQEAFGARRRGRWSLDGQVEEETSKVSVGFARCSA